jgi:hypothetical protein
MAPDMICRKWDGFDAEFGSGGGVVEPRVAAHRLEAFAVRRIVKSVAAAGGGRHRTGGSGADHRMRQDKVGEPSTGDLREGVIELVDLDMMSR